MRVKKNNGNVVRGLRKRFVCVSGAPNRRKAAIGRVLCRRKVRPCVVLLSVNKHVAVEAVVQGEGPRRLQTYAHLHGRGASRPPGLLGYQPSSPPNAFRHGERGGMCKFLRRTSLPPVSPPF